MYIPAYIHKYIYVYILTHINIYILYIHECSIEQITSYLSMLQNSFVYNMLFMQNIYLFLSIQVLFSPRAYGYTQTHKHIYFCMQCFHVWMCAWYVTVTYMHRYFRDDGLHLSSEGYAIWAGLVAQVLTSHDTRQLSGVPGLGQGVVSVRGWEAHWLAVLTSSFTLCCVPHF